MIKLNVYQTEVSNYEVRDGTLHGQDYIIVPVVMMVEGVHNGNLGAVLHTAEELGKVAEAWNGIPIVIKHPQLEGQAVSANQPDILEESGVGIVFNAQMDGVKLKAEAWFNKTQLATFEVINNRISNCELIEVSIGAHTEFEVEEGQWNDQDYVAIAHNFRPDHLAVLPTQLGACSIDKGCGLGNNSENMIVNEENRNLVLQELKQQGLVINNLVVNESLTEIVDKVRSKLYSLDGDQAYYYAEEIYEGYLIYRKEDRVNDESKLWKQSYQVNNGVVEFVGEPVQVNRQVTYTAIIVNKDGHTIRQRNANLNTNLKKEDIMPECKACEKKVNALIANAETKWSEDDKELLMTFSEDQLEKLDPTVVVEEPAKTEEPKVSKEMVINAMKDLSEDEFVKLMPTSMKESLDSAKAAKKEMVDGIIANSEEGEWTELELNAMSDKQIKKIAKVLVKQPELGNYAGQGAGGFTQLQNKAFEDANKVEPMAATGIEFETKKE